MSARIPSSLVWLFDKRARLDAEVRKAQSSIVKAQELIKELSVLKEDLLAIDRTLALHEISIDLDLIKPINSQCNRINLPYGELTSSILSCLRLHNGQPVTKKEIIEFIVSRNPNLMTSLGIDPHLRRSVNNRLKNLFKKGIVQRHHPPQTTGEGMWSLVLREND